MADLTSKVSLARLQEAQQAQAQEAQARAAAQAQLHKAKSNRSGTEGSNRGSNASRCSRDTRSEADLSENGSSESPDVDGVPRERPKGIHGRKLGAMRLLKRLGSASRRKGASATDSVLDEPPHPPEQR